MIKEYIEHIIEGNDLSMEEAETVMLRIMEGSVNASHIAALLTALKCKGETHEEIAGFAQAMRKMSIKLDAYDTNTVDVCGTGGDHSGTFNISTAASFVVAAAGIRVAKHGNRSISSISGSADVLIELGANINLSPERSAQALDEVGITFLFAPDYHPAMKHVAPVRRELAMKTVFNILGPLTNPAGTRKQLIGTFNDHTAGLMSRAAGLLDMDKVCFICSENRYDEVLLSGSTRVFEYSGNGTINEYSISQHTFGYPEVPIAEIRGDSPGHNAAMITDLFRGKDRNGVFFTTVANAALGLYAAGYASDLESCRTAAEDAVLSGAAYDKLQQFITFGRAVQ